MNLVAESPNLGINPLIYGFKSNERNYGFYLYKFNIKRIIVFNFCVPYS